MNQLNRIAKAKINDFSLGSLDRAYDDFIATHPNSSSLTRLMFKELIALDDWQSIAQQALPYILKYGPPAVQWLYKRIVGGDDEKQEDVYKHVSALQAPPSALPVTATPWTIQAPSYGGVVKGARSVDVRYLKAFFYPESNLFQRRPSQMAAPTAVHSSTVVYPITTDANGNALFFVYPNQIANPSYAAYQGSFAYQTSSWNPVTGVCTMTTAPVSGPLTQQLTATGTSPNVTGASYFRVNLMFILCMPKLSYVNNSGDYLLLFKNSFVSPSEQAAGSATVQTLALQELIPFKPRNAPFTTQLRAIKRPLHMALDAAKWFQPSTFNVTSAVLCDQSAAEGFIVAIRGSAASTQVMDVYISYEVESLPYGNSLATFSAAVSDDYNATDDFIASLFTLAPELTYLSNDQAIEFTKRLVSAGTCDYDELLAVALAHAGTVKLQGTAFGHPVAPGGAVPYLPGAPVAGDQIIV